MKEIKDGSTIKMLLFKWRTKNNLNLLVESNPENVNCFITHILRVWILQFIKTIGFSYKEYDYTGWRKINLLLLYNVYLYCSVKILN